MIGCSTNQVPKSSNILTFKYTLETHRIFRHEQTGVKTKMTLYLNGFFLGGGYLKILTSNKGYLKNSDVL